MLVVDKRMSWEELKFRGLCVRYPSKLNGFSFNKEQGTTWGLGLLLETVCEAVAGCRKMPALGKHLKATETTVLASQSPHGATTN